jgi:uncharacterized repeat protein (TIGR01451 family)
MFGRSRRFAVVGFAAAVTGGVLVGGFSGVAVAASVPTTIVSDSFTNSHPNDPSAWRTLDTPGSVVNHACLTHDVPDAVPATTGSTPIPNPCSDTPPPDGLDSLQLTPAVTNLVGGIQYTHAVPTTSAIDATFKSYELDGAAGQKADGNAFFFAASNPSNSDADAITIGGNGGSLGYAGPSVGGLEHGYLGVGLDAFGNFANGTLNGTGCSGGSLSAQTVTVRGPGNGTAGYCKVGQTAASSGTLNYESEASPAGEYVPVEVMINPTGSSLNSPGSEDLGLTSHPVPAGKFLVVFKPLGGSEQTVSGNLPNATSFLPAGWADGNGVPKNLTFGWTAATGSGTDYHNIADVAATSITPVTPPALSLQLSNDSSEAVHNGDTVTYTARTTVTNGDETGQIQVMDTLPAGLTPGNAGDANWNCAASSGQTVDCTHIEGTITSGSSVDLSIPVTVNLSGSARGVDNTASVQSTDASNSPASSNTNTIYWAPTATATVLQFINQPLDTDVNAPMVNTDNTQRQVTVGGYLTAGGSLDTNYDGTVTLAFASNPSGAQFVVGSTPTATMTAQAVNGVADFSPIIVNKSGLGYTLTATDTPDALTQATSDSFNAGSATGCPAGQTCQTNTSSNTGDNALVQGQTGSTNTIIFAVYGGNVAPLYGCSTKAPGILTFSGDRQKIITVTIPVSAVKKQPITKFCWGQPTEWYGVVNGQVDEIHHFNNKNKDLEGQLATCSALAQKHKTGPCIQSITWSKGHPETAVIKSGSADPHLVR